MTDRDHWKATGIELFKARYGQLWEMGGDLSPAYDKFMALHMAKFDAEVAKPPVMSQDEAAAVVAQNRSDEAKAFNKPNGRAHYESMWGNVAEARGLKPGTPEWTQGKDGFLAAYDQAAAKG
jgi:hypothetical protein